MLGGSRGGGPWLEEPVARGGGLGMDNGLVVRVVDGEEAVMEEETGRR